ncbi:MAG: glycoside hydrolase family 3 C-terminal domain-containing protein [Bacteroidales bacterium]|nr:glycoside hydrolase family 3 C-terminal domain-containing protein [Bacteroidales bacterium]
MKKLLIRSGFLIISCVVVMAFIPASVPAKKPIYLNTAYSFEERAADLVSRLTPEEKQSLLGNTMPAVPRLGINPYDVWGEALHGVMGRTFISGRTATSFPNSVALGSAWDPELMKRETSVIADEARGFNYDVIYTLTYWSPVIEPVRDPRWGRTGEAFGEDPFLVSQIGRGFIEGLMGNDPVYLKAVPCGKHYFANNSEFNRHTGSSDMDDRDMREFYLLPYKNLIEKSRLPGIMTCYNAVNGVPMSANKFLVDTIARKTYGLNGYITGDCGAISDMFSGHNYAKSNAEAAAMGLRSGVDTDCGSVYQTSALEAIKQGLITEADMDIALTNLFTVRMRTGEFDPKSKVPYAGIRPDVINSPGHVALAVEIATKTPVLLKNNVVAKTGRKALPIKADAVKKIAVIGPQADRVELGPYSGRPEESNIITPLAGIRNYIEQNKINAEIGYHQGGNTLKTSEFFTLAGFSTVTKDGAVRDYDASKFDAAADGIVIGGRQAQNVTMRGVNDNTWSSYNDIDITNVDSIRFNLNVTSPDGGVIEVRLGSATGNLIATAKVTGSQQGGGFGGFGGFGRTRTVSIKLNTLGVTGPQTLVFVYRAPEGAPIDKEALDLASSSDVALVFVGTDESTAREESDRFNIQLPGNQYELIKSVTAVNPNTIIVIQSLGMVEVEQFKDNPNVAGIIWTGFNGQAQGTAMARILFGDVNPGGKLNATWYKSLNDLPPITDYTLRGGNGKNGRTYWYFKKDVSYEFGYGLSYTTFEYSNFSISRSSVTPNDRITVSVDVKNTGEVDGDEVVQVYMRTPDSPASLERPVKRLKGFKRVTIAAGQTKTVCMDIDCSDLWFWDGEKDRITFDQGRYVFEIGSSSKDIRGQVETRMSGTYKPALKTVVAECGKVVLKPGNTVQTSVTAAMSDDSFYNIRDAKVTYKSNNPSVASVDERGQVTARGVGTASIFAYVTVDGNIVSDNYPLKVMPDLRPSSITVNGKQVTGFNPGITGYSFLLKDASAVPKVNATAAGTDITVDVAQVKNIPGTALITLTDNVTIEKNFYNVNFGTRSVKDEFKSASLGNQWSWVRENPANWSLTKKPGSLVITAETGEIISGNNNAANILLQDANTDWTIESRVVFSRRPSGFSQNGGLLAYQDDDNFVKLVYRAGGGGRRGMGGFGGPGGSGVSGVQPGAMELLIEKDGYQSSVATLNMADIIKDNNTLILKFEKKGNIYSAFCSSDGKKFTIIGSAEIPLRDVRAGIIVCNGAPMAERGRGFQGMPQGMQPQQSAQPDEPFEVSYDYFRINNKGLK